MLKVLYPRAFSGVFASKSPPIKDFYKIQYIAPLIEITCPLI
jgi:hypothetical protein